MAYYFALEFILIILTLIFRPYICSDASRKAISIKYNHILVSREAMYSFLCCVVLSLFMGMRNDFTADYNSYAGEFQKNAAQSFKGVITDNDYMELGYRILNKVIGIFSTNIGVYMTIIASAFVFLIILEGRKEVISIYIYILLFVNCGIYFLTFNLMRQGLAAAIAYAATDYLRRGNRRKYFIAIIIATSIHTSAIVMLPHAVHKCIPCMGRNHGFQVEVGCRNSSQSLERGWC